MRVDVLGPLRVCGAAGEVRVPRGRTAAALCWLALHAGAGVTPESLAGVLWPRPPERAAARARLIARSLEPLLDPGTVEVGRLLRLVVDDDAVDAVRFERLVLDARRYLATDDRARQQANLTQALGLWRGDPCPELRHALAAGPALGRLADLHVEAIEELTDLRLAGAVDYAVVADLRAHLVLHPDRPRLHRQLAVALYRTGRQVAALEVLRALRDGLGDPDGRSAVLQAAILRQESDLRA